MVTLTLTLDKSTLETLEALADELRTNPPELAAHLVRDNTFKMAMLLAEERHLEPHPRGGQR